MGILLLFPAPIHAEITVRADAIGRIHSFRESDRTGNTRNDPTVSHPLLNLRANGTFDRGLQGYGEFYIGENGSGEAFEIGELWGSTGDIFSTFRTKLGKLEVPYGTQRHYRSDHADVQSNPLIGNPLVDPTDHQMGVMISGDHNSPRWEFALTNGTDENNLRADRGFSAAAAVSFRPLDQAELSLSGYRSQHGDTRAGSDTGSLANDNLFGPDRIRSQGFSQVQSNQSAPYPEIDDSFGLQPNVLSIGRDLTAWQADLKLKMGGLWRARYGQMQDDFSDLNRSLADRYGKVKWSYWSIDHRVPLSIPGYLAGRWGRLNADQLKNSLPLGEGIERNGSIERFQLGWGHQMSRNFRVKFEYVHSEEDLTERRLEFDGLSFEVSLTGIPKLDAKHLGDHTTETGIAN